METNFIVDPKIVLSSLYFNDGNTVELDQDQILVIVGPNNAGKSASIKEIYNYMTNNNSYSTKRIITGISLSKIGDSADLTNYIRRNTYIDPVNQHPAYHYLSEHPQQNGGQNYSQISKFHIDLVDLVRKWESNSILGYDFGGLFVNYLTISKRLLVSKPAEPFNLFKENSSHPIHHLIENESLNVKFSELFKTAFNQDILINRGVASKINLYVGTAPVIDANSSEDRTSLSYIKRLIELPNLEEQGDGMRGFVGVLLSVLVASQSLLMIDEPEAFLHPPQARLLGKFIGKEIPDGKQIIIATHSEDILKGLIDVASKRLKIIRLRRENNHNQHNRSLGYLEVNHVSELRNSDIRGLWDDPILRYSNILSGLFHSKIILCEGDADCRFYSAINDILLDDKNVAGEKIGSDLLFVHCGGKGKMYIVINALRKLDVPISVAVDIDILREVASLKKIMSSLGGNWDDISDHYKILSKFISDTTTELNKETIKAQIISLLDQGTESILTRDDTEAISKLIKKPSIWERIKKNGKSELPSGSVYNSFEKITDYLRGIGLHVVEVGELECFVRSVGHKGPEWVNEALEKINSTEPPDLTNAKKFVQELVN